MVKNIYTRIVGLWLVLSVGIHYLNFWIPGSREAGARQERKIISAGYALLKSGNYDSFNKFKKENKWEWRTERNGFYILVLILTGLAVIWFLVN